MPRVDEFVLCGATVDTDFARSLASFCGNVPVRCVADLGIDPPALQSAGVALLGLLHLEQVPANTSATTGARTPRVLGRLTPGSVVNWHRLVRELAARRPSTVALRCAL